jgi:hypothetical protein
VRLAMVVPADLVARLLGAGAGAGTLAAWAQVPAADEGYLKLVALATWWVGALVGGLLVWRGGGRWTDVGCGVLAGAVAGLAGGATLGCLLVVGDAPARALLGWLLGGRALAAGAATPLWIATTLMCWTLLGAAVGLALGLCGEAGRRVMTGVTRPLVVTLRACGMGSLAEAIEP